ncbi:MAG: hypothetical protein WCK89_06635 [bacterium]
MRMRVSRLVFVALALLVLLAAWQSRRLAVSRRARLPEAYAGYTSDVPPALTFVMVGLGGFRGIISEVLWFRFNRLQEEGRYLELVQLADWITRLDPYAAEVWIYNAWNLAYNVSIMMVRDEDRLRWVQNGIALLRDDGLRFNPREARLYRELAWLYQNKIGDTLDSAHVRYKLALAQTMAPFVNPDGTVNVTPGNRARLATLRLDADRMAALEKRFGPFDWRLAEAHAVYWASQGLEYAVGTERLMCRRGVYQPLILCVFRGRFTGDLSKNQWQTASNFGLATASLDFIAETLVEFPSQTLSAVYVRYLSLLVKELHRQEQGLLAHACYQRLLDVLSPDIAHPTFEDVANGWELKNEKD